MKSVFKGLNVSKSLLTIALLFLTVFQSNGQQSKPAQNGFVTVNGIKVYYEIDGEDKPIVLLHGAFMTLREIGNKVI